MADYFFTDSPGRGRLIADIATWFYEAAVADGVVAARDA
jgi:hypothetical protein